MPEMTRMDVLVFLIIGSVFILGLWSMIFAFLFGIQKRLDKIILRLDRFEKKIVSRD